MATASGQLFARDHIAGALVQPGQQLKRLLLQAQLRTVPAQLARGEIELEDRKPRKSAGVALESGHETIPDRRRLATRSVAPSRGCARLRIRKRHPPFLSGVQ
jgi:hypothetical protein